MCDPPLVPSRDPATRSAAAPDASRRPANFLISYSGRVGSTALIDTLKQIPGFVVPVFEELDFWWLERQGLLDQHTAENIHELVDYTYRTLPAGVDPARVSVGFKWRVWGMPAELARVLRAHDAIVLNMVRCDALEFISSLYLTDVVNQEFNAPQFLLRDARTEEERLHILFRYRMQKTRVDLDAFFRLFEEKLRVETERLTLLKDLQRRGTEVYTILYEDFAYMRYRFLDALLRLLRQPRLARLPAIDLEKVAGAYPSERFVNRAELLGSERLISGLRAWHEMIFGAEFSFAPVC
jgi:hypothetical protein